MSVIPIGLVFKFISKSRPLTMPCFALSLVSSSGRLRFVAQPLISVPV